MKSIVFGHKAPEYLPSLAYCALMDCVDRFYVDLNVQYSRQSFQNRARLRTPDGIQWITVPIRGGQFGRPIGEIEIEYGDSWVRKHEKAFRFNYGSTPFYEHYAPPLVELLRSRHDSLGSLTVGLLTRVHAMLELTSELIDGSPSASEVNAPDEPRFEMVDLVFEPRRHGHQTVIPGPPTRYLEYDHPLYRQNFDGFQPGMSILDLLFNHGPEARDILQSGLKAAGGLDRDQT